MKTEYPALPLLNPLISATDLASRWGCHVSTIARKVKAGTIRPALESGTRKSFSMVDVLRFESGQMPRQQNTATLTAGQKAALPVILSLLGLDGANHTQRECVVLCSVYHSLSYEDRRDEGVLSERLELIRLGLSAVCRAETIETVGASPVLMGMVRDLYTTVIGLIPYSQRGGLPA